MSEQPLIDVTPTTFTYGGEVMGRLEDGRAVFIPYVLPGERVRIRLVEEKRGYARAELVEVLQGAPERILARCPHFGVCGGCHYQHMPYETQLQVKTDILRDQLERIGGLSGVRVDPAVPAPQPFNYRNHIQFHLAEDGKLGFQAARSNRVVPVTECHLPEEPLANLWPQLDVEFLPGLERVSLRVGGGDDLQLIFESSEPEPFEFSVEELAVSAVHLGPGGCLVLAGSDVVTFEVLGRFFQVSAGAFFQVNTAQAAGMVQHVLAHLPLKPGGTLLDVYCGVGLFSAFCASQVGRVVGIEASPYACEDFAVNLDEFEHVELYQATAEEVLGSMQFHPDAVIVDPPRAGLGKDALDGLLKQSAPWLAYVSCDPSTLARDARRLVQGGYALERVTPFDLFPQTYHIESISLWQKL
jgi:23S rRNA (uracil1939-C5)-methyltransferase